MEKTLKFSLLLAAFAVMLFSCSSEEIAKISADDGQIGWVTECADDPEICGVSPGGGTSSGGIGGGGGSSSLGGTSSSSAWGGTPGDGMDPNVPFPGFDEYGQVPSNPTEQIALCGSECRKCTEVSMCSQPWFWEKNNGGSICSRQDGYSVIPCP